MSEPDPSQSALEKEVLRQREIEAQLNALRSPAPNTRAAAARRLGDLKTGISELLDSLRDPSDYVRAAAAMALGSFKDHERAEEIGEFLLAAIDDSSERVCQSAIRSLGMLQIRHARAEIETFLDDPNPYILGSAILALARLDAQDLAGQLAGYIRHESLYVQMQAARAAAILGYTQVGPEIVRLLKNTRAARQAAGFTDPSASRDRHSSDLYNLQNQLIRAAGDLKLQDATPLLLDTAQKDIGFRGLAVEALIAIGAEIDPQILSRLLADPGVYLRKRLLALFAQYNYTHALPLLRPMLNDENFMIRVAALQALAQMRDSESIPRIAWLCSHDPNPFLRVQAVQTLVVLQGRDALATLLALTHDANFQVRRTAAAYLVDWKEYSAAALRALAQFAMDFPEDTLSPTIQSILTDCGYRAEHAAVRADQPERLLPRELEHKRDQLIALLKQWQDGLNQPASGDGLAVRSAVDLLLDTLGE